MHVSLIVTYRHRKSFLPRFNSSKQRSESSTCYCFWLVVCKRDTHFENDLGIPKYSCKIIYTLPSDIFKVSVAISCNCNLRSPKTILWIFVMFSETTADFGQPERSALSVFVRPHLNSAYQSMIFYFPGAEPITCIKTLFWFISIFSHWKAVFD